jgi:nucleoside-diphosphate-sugar epimerase
MGALLRPTHGLPVTMFRFFTVYGPWGGIDGERVSA